MTTDRKCVLSRHRLVFDTSRARPSFLPLATLCLLFPSSLTIIVVAIIAIVLEERNRIFVRDESVCWLPPLSFLNNTPTRARRFFSLLRSFLDADQSLSFTTTTTRARACARKSADTTTKAREWCLSAESSRRRNQ
jgi:hypothetical protein